MVRNVRKYFSPKVVDAGDLLIFGGDNTRPVDSP
jgi:hypothetical protein